MRHDCELATWADVPVQFRLVVNAYERHLASLNDGEICRALLLAAPGSGAAWMRRYEGTSTSQKSVLLLWASARNTCDRGTHAEQLH